MPLSVKPAECGGRWLGCSQEPYLREVVAMNLTRRDLGGGP
jgi:hypothetical protein